MRNVLQIALCLALPAIQGRAAVSRATPVIDGDRHFVVSDHLLVSKNRAGNDIAGSPGVCNDDPLRIGRVNLAGLHRGQHLGFVADRVSGPASAADHQPSVHRHGGSHVVSHVAGAVGRSKSHRLTWLQHKTFGGIGDFPVNLAAESRTCHAPGNDAVSAACDKKDQDDTGDPTQFGHGLSFLVGITFKHLVEEPQDQDQQSSARNLADWIAPTPAPRPVFIVWVVVSDDRAGAEFGHGLSFQPRGCGVNSTRRTYV